MYTPVQTEPLIQQNHVYTSTNWTLNTTESCIHQYKLNPEYNRITYTPVQIEPWIQQNHVYTSTNWTLNTTESCINQYCCIQGSVCTGLCMILLYSGFSLYWFIHDSVVFRVQFVLVYTWFCCIQGSVCTGVYVILLYSGFSLSNWTLNTTESCIH
jgi:hypothetical protein